MRLDLSTRPTDRSAIAPLWGAWLPLALAFTGLVLTYTAPRFSAEVFLTEGWGPVEMTHILMPLATAIVAVLALRTAGARATWRLQAWLAALILGSIYIAGEEASWGQHFFHWSTPEYWAGINRQEETNLHNVSSWLNHKPRILLQVGIILTVIVMPVARRFGWLGALDRQFALVMPRPDSYFIGWLAIFYKVWDDLSKNAGFPDIATREAELQETFIFGFLLIYALGLRHRIGLLAARRSPSSEGAAAAG